jgi:enoyl-CoA hydratase
MNMGSVTVATHETYAILTINRPEALNALNREVLEGIDAAWSRLEAEGDIRSVIVTGAGERAFVAGADIREIRAIANPAAAEAFARFGQGVFNRIADSRLISFMAINGFALGGGLELAMAGDYRIMAEEAQVGQPEILLGIIPGFGGTQRLKDLIGSGRALWLIASGERVDAARALSWGIVDEVTPRARLLSRAEEMAASLGAKAPLALAAAKRAVHAAGPLEDRLRAEAAQFGLVGCSDDAREGTSAFLEKRTPRFLGT